MAVHGDGRHGLLLAVHRHGDVRRSLIPVGGGDVRGHLQHVAVVGRAGGDHHLAVDPVHVELVLRAGEDVSQIPDPEVGAAVGAHKGGGGAALVQVGDVYVAVTPVGGGGLRLRGGLGLRRQGGGGQGEHQGRRQHAGEDPAHSIVSHDRSSFPAGRWGWGRPPPDRVIIARKAGTVDRIFRKRHGAPTLYNIEKTEDSRMSETEARRRRAFARRLRA